MFLLKFWDQTKEKIQQTNLLIQTEENEERVWEHPYLDKTQMSDSFFCSKQNELTLKNCLVWFDFQVCSFRFFSLFSQCQSEYSDLALDEGPGDRRTSAPHQVWSWPWSSVYFAAVTLINLTCPADSPVDVMAHRAVHHTPRWREPDRLPS